MLNPEYKLSINNNVSAAVEYKILENPKSLELPNLQKIIEDQITFKNREIHARVNGEKIPLINQESRVVFGRTILYGAKNAFLKNVALEMQEAGPDNIIVRENLFFTALNN
jgi:hypothetical protein